MANKLDGPKILYLDIEMAPNKGYIWGSGKQIVPANHIFESGYTLCWAAKWEGSKDIIFDKAWTKTGKITYGRRKAMVRHMHKLLNEADFVVHFNGTKFDLPKLNTEFLKFKLGPCSPVAQIDLYRQSKKFSFASHKLDYISQELGYGAKITHAGMALWHDVMYGDTKAQSFMEKYNKQDVRLLEPMYKDMRPWIQPHPNFGLYMSTLERVCPNCGSTNLVRQGMRHTATMSYYRYQCKSCLKWSSDRTNCLTREKKDGILKGIN